MSLNRVEAITRMRYQVSRPGSIHPLPLQRCLTMSDITSGNQMDLILVLRWLASNNTVTVIRQHHMPDKQRRAQFIFFPHLSRTCLQCHKYDKFIRDRLWAVSISSCFGRLIFIVSYLFWFHILLNVSCSLAITTSIVSCPLVAYLFSQCIYNVRTIHPMHIQRHFLPHHSSRWRSAQNTWCYNLLAPE